MNNNRFPSTNRFTSNNRREKKFKNNRNYDKSIGLSIVKPVKPVYIDTNDELLFPSLSNTTKIDKSNIIVDDDKPSYNNIAQTIEPIITKNIDIPDNWVRLSYKDNKLYKEYGKITINKRSAPRQKTLDEKMNICINNLKDRWYADNERAGIFVNYDIELDDDDFEYIYDSDSDNEYYDDDYEMNAELAGGKKTPNLDKLV